jgi:tetratricopeptide (TPR) repeat protein
MKTLMCILGFAGILFIVGCGTSSAPQTTGTPKTEPPKTEEPITVKPEPPKLEEIIETGMEKLLQMGEVMIYEENYQKALAVYQKIITLENIPKEALGSAHYNSACMYSLLKDKENSLKSLELAIKYGFDNQEFIDADKDLEFVRGSEEYKNVLKLIPPIAEVAPTPQDEKDQAEAIELIEKVRGLKLKEPVKHKILTSDQFARVYGQQADSIQGFYRWSDKTLYIRKELDPVKFKATRIHETFHGLQDQLFDIAALNKKVTSTEVRYIRDALIEGDASLTFIECMPESKAKMMLEMPPPWKSAKNESDFGPKMVQSVLSLYNYSIGAKFIKAIKESEGWEGVNKLYENFPKSTEQILHPEKYLKGVDLPVAVNMPDLAEGLGENWKQSPPDTQGEFVMLLQFLSNPKTGFAAERYSIGWGGDTYIQVFNTKEKTGFTAWSTVWDTEKDAQEFAEGMSLHIESSLEKEIAPAIADNARRYDDGKISSAVYQKGKTAIVLQEVPNELFDGIMKKLRQ